VGTARLHVPHNVLKVADAAGEAIDAGHHQHVALAEEIEHAAQFLAPRGRGAAPLLGADHLAPGRRQGAFAASAGIFSFAIAFPWAEAALGARPRRSMRRPRHDRCF
jgi:hypothetical protein